MNASIETITSEALHLSQDQRLTLAHRILASVEPAPDAQVESELRLILFSGGNDGAAGEE